MNIFEDAPFGLPSFVQERAEPIPNTGTSGEFVFWSPEKTGDDGLDYALGRQHFATAVSFARAISAENFLSFVFMGVCNAGLGPMERGFIDALAVKATYGTAPAPISESEAQRLLSVCGTSEEETRFGESEALEYMVMARETQCPDVIAALLESIVMGTMERGHLSFLWIICGAAYLGALN